MDIKTQALIAALEMQRNAALTQVVQLMAENAELTEKVNKWEAEQAAKKQAGKGK